MADQQRWFKLWCAAVADDALQKLTPAQRWAWAAFGCHTKMFGHHGVVTITEDNAVLAASMGIPTVDLKKTITLFPNCGISERAQSDGEFTVTWKNWHKYQSDSSRARTQRWRQNVTEQKRREQKRVTNTNKQREVSKKETEKPVSSYQIPERVLASLSQCQILGAAESLRVPAWWQAQILAFDVPMADELLKAESWLVSNPRRRPKNLRQFLRNWLARAAEGT